MLWKVLEKVSMANKFSIDKSNYQKEQPCHCSATRFVTNTQEPSQFRQNNRYTVKATLQFYSSFSFSVPSSSAFSDPFTSLCKPPTSREALKGVRITKLEHTENNAGTMRLTQGSRYQTFFIDRYRDVSVVT